MPYDQIEATAKQSGKVCVCFGWFFFLFWGGVGWGGGEEIKKKKTNGHQNVESWQSNWNFSKNNQLYFQQDNDNY